MNKTIALILIFFPLLLHACENPCNPFQDFIRDAIKSGKPIDKIEAAALKAQVKAAGCSGDFRMPIKQHHEPFYVHAGAYVTCLLERINHVPGIPPTCGPHTDTFLGCFATLDPLDPQNIEHPKNERGDRWRSLGIYQSTELQQSEKAYEELLECWQSPQTAKNASLTSSGKMTSKIKKELCAKHWRNLSLRTQ